MKLRFGRKGVPGRQRGAVTLIISFIILVAMALGIYSVVNTTLLETRMTANDSKGRQAMQNAQAGIDFFLAALESGNPDPLVICNTDTKGDFGFELSFGFEPDGVTPIPCDSIPFAIATKFDNVRSTGYSSDFESVRIIESTIDLSIKFSYSSAPPPPPSGVGGGAFLRSGGLFEAGGNVFVGRCGTGGSLSCDDVAKKGGGQPLAQYENDPNDVLIVSGDAVRPGGSANFSAGNFIASDPDTQTSRDNGTFFQDYVSPAFDLDGRGSTLTDYATLASDPTSRVYNYSNSSGFDGALASGKTYIYVDATTTPLVLGSNVTLGSATEPIVLVVNGPLVMNGGATVWGTVYADTVDLGAGTATVIGSLFAENDITGKGGLQVADNIDARVVNSEPDPSRIIANAQDRISTVRIGSWREIFVN